MQGLFCGKLHISSTDFCGYVDKYIWLWISSRVRAYSSSMTTTTTNILYHHHYHIHFHIHIHIHVEIVGVCWHPLLIVKKRAWTLSIVGSRIRSLFLICIGNYFLHILETILQMCYTTFARKTVKKMSFYECPSKKAAAGTRCLFLFTFA